MITLTFANEYTTTVVLVIVLEILLEILGVMTFALWMLG